MDSMRIQFPFVKLIEMNFCFKLFDLEEFKLENFFPIGYCQKYIVILFSIFFFLVFQF